MKFKLPLFLLAAAMLASCGGNTTPSSEQSATTPESSQTASHLYLDWVNDNKIVIDLFDIGDARFSYGNAALSGATQILELNASAGISCSTTLTKETTVNFVVVTEAPSSTGFNAAAAVYPGIEGDQLSEFLADRDDLQGKTRAYVAISFGETVKWTKNHNADMDAKIQQLIDAAK